MYLLLFIAQSCLTLYDPMDPCVSGFPVLHYLPEFAQFFFFFLLNFEDIKSFNKENLKNRNNLKFKIHIL